MRKLCNVLAAILAVITILTSVSIPSFADKCVIVSFTNGDFDYAIDDNGGAIVARYNGSATKVVIPSKVNGYTVTSIGYYAFERRQGTVP